MGPERGKSKGGVYMATVRAQSLSPPLAGRQRAAKSGDPALQPLLESAVISSTSGKPFGGSAHSNAAPDAAPLQLGA